MNKSVRIEVTAKSTPFHGDREGSAAFYEALGRVSCLWGRFEHNVASDLLIILNLPEAKALARPLPVSWKHKKTLWRDAFNALPSLSEWKAHALEFISDADDVARNRHVLQHSTWWGFKSDDPLAADFRMMRERKGMIFFERYSVTLEHLQELIADIDALNCRLMPFMFKISSLQPPVRLAPNKSSSQA